MKPPVKPPAKPPQHATQPPERPRDLLWDACVAACGGITPSNKIERGKWNKGLAALRESEATPEDVAIRAERYKRRYGAEIALNPMALASNWTILAQEVAHHARNTGSARSAAATRHGANRSGGGSHGAHGTYTGPHLPDADELKEWARQQRAAGVTNIIGG
jgi:hypothetical protein